ncbi:MAG TPA: hypothetical protein PK361_08935 [Chiayiivirga sp.]|nr:hypothetical protein [Chiayiivirga sp.]
MTTAPGRLVQMLKVDPSRLQDRVDILGLLALHGTTMDIDWLERSASALGATYGEQLEELIRESGSTAPRRATDPGL